eukprot:33002_2
MTRRSFSVLVPPLLLQTRIREELLSWFALAQDSCFLQHAFPRATFGRWMPLLCFLRCFRFPPLPSESFLGPQQRAHHVLLSVTVCDKLSDSRNHLHLVFDGGWCDVFSSCVMISSFLRPTITNPSSSILPRSPVSHPSVSIVAAVALESFQYPLNMNGPLKQSSPSSKILASPPPIIGPTEPSLCHPSKQSVTGPLVSLI